MIFINFPIIEEKWYSFFLSSFLLESGSKNIEKFTLKIIEYNNR